MKYYVFFLFTLIAVWVSLPARLSAQEGDTVTARKLEITEAKLGSNVEDRVLTGEDSTFSLGSKVFLWMKITGASSDEITVTWKFGTMTHATTLTVGGSPWRTWATKIVGKAGDWSVSVTDSSGSVLKELSFKILNEN